VLIDDNVGVLSLEHALDLLEDGLCLVTGLGQFTEGVVLVGAPEEATLGEASLSVAVGAHSDVVITIDTCNCQK